MLSFEEVRALLAALPKPDKTSASAARARQSRLVKPPGSLGRLENIAIWLAAWRGKERGIPVKPALVIFAAGHGVTRHGVSAWPSGVTEQMVAAFRNGGGAVNQLARCAGAALDVVDLTDRGLTADITQAAAMDEAGCLDAINAGMAALPADCDLLGLGDMGIGNTTIAAALGCALFGGQAEGWVGPGAGSDAAGMARKRAVVAQALAYHGAALGDPLEALRRVGGWEVAALVGAILEARRRRIPVLLDGYVVSAAAAVLHKAAPGALDHCLAAHCSAEPAHGRLLGEIGKKPLLDLGLRLGEGTGAALALSIVRAAAEVHDGMATFEESAIRRDVPPANP